jgi:RsiW-degrading membrane proteinase PrsW (M82 family)
MSSHGVGAVACVALGVPWALAGSWRACGGTLSRIARASLGGLAAAELAWLAYGVLEVAGLGVRFERLERGDLHALGTAAIIGLVEEGAKLGGALIALPQARCDARDRFRIILAVAAAFATVEAVLVLPGAAWPVLLARAALAPAAHALLAAPVALAFAGAGGSSSGAVSRIAGGLSVAALLHALGDFGLTQPPWGRAAFATTLLLPAIWLYACGRRRDGRDREGRSPPPGRGAAALPRAFASR